MAVDGSLNFDTKINMSGFEKGIETMQKGIGKLSASLKNFAKLAASAFGIGDISSFIAETRSLWQTQLEAEARLEQVMKNTTNATEEQIQATKDWASALQEVGVIGDEIQLSGLQELATYIENADSLKTMNVVLNDMLAQQYGLNASAESAVTIATMLGKVLEGQTGALSRYGYSFDEAQEQLLKFGTEEQKVATLAEVVEQSVGGMNEALAKTPAGRLQQVSNTMGDIKEQFGQAFTNLGTLFIPALERLAGLLSKAASYAVKLSSELMKIFGMEADNSAAAASSISDAVASQEELTDAVLDTEKAQEKSLAGFDKINKLSGGSSDDSSDDDDESPNIITLPDKVFEVDADTSKAERKLHTFIEKIKRTFEQLKKFLTGKFSGIFNNVWNGLSAETQELYETFSKCFGDMELLGNDFVNYLKTDFVSLLQTVFSTAGDIVTGLFDTFNLVFRDIWDLAVYPIISDFINIGLPIITQFTEEVIKTFGTLFSEINKLFQKLWKDAVRPILNRIAKLWQDVLSSFKQFWDKWGSPIFEKFRQAIKLTGDVLQNFWNTIGKPVFDKFMKTADELWSEHLKPFIDNFLDLVGMIADGALDIYNKFIVPVANWLTAFLEPVITQVWGTICDVVGNAVGSIIDAGNRLIDAFKAVLNFVRAVFQGDWERAWNCVKDAFANVWNALTDIMKIPINAIIGLINGMLSALERGINSVINAMNRLKWEIPNWVPGIGGRKFGFNFGSVSFPQIPYLAQGTVVPANYGEFLAVLGDNKREPEIVSPESTIENAVLRAMQRVPQGGDIHIHVDVDGREIGRIAVKAVDLNNARRGRK